MTTSETSHPIDASFLQLIQTRFPLEAQPFALMAKELDVSEDLVLERLTALREQGTIRQVSAIFDTKHLGFGSSLVAAKVAPERADEAAAVFSAHPGVSHNYLREHEFNIWFTVAVPPDSTLGLDRTIELLGQLAEVDSIRALPVVKLFKIGVNLDVKGDRDPSARSDPKLHRKPSGPPPEITDRDKDAIRALQIDLPATSRPFHELAERFGFDEDELIACGKRFLETGQMRRYAAVLAHRAAGFTFNGMGVWHVPDDRVEEVGTLAGSFAGISHCYQRPSYPDWPYNLFTMTHGRTKEDCEAILAALARESGLDEYMVLYSTKQYKKVRVSYFTPEIEAWEEKYALLAT